MYFEEFLLIRKVIKLKILSFVAQKMLKNHSSDKNSDLILGVKHLSTEKESEKKLDFDFHVLIHFSFFVFALNYSVIFLNSG